MQILESTMLTYFGNTFPEIWLWGKEEKSIITGIKHQIESKWPEKDNLLINLTWFGPEFTQFDAWKNYKDLISKGKKYHNLFLLCTVDPPGSVLDHYDSIVESFGHPRVFKMGNFDGEYHFNFFAPAMKKYSPQYDVQDLLLTDVKWTYINYNRKPRDHRVELVKKLLASRLNQHGVITLGRDPRAPDDNLYLTIGEDAKDYVKFGHWSTDDKFSDFGIPHDVLSLHNMQYWKHHFLHIIGATLFNYTGDIFVSETQFKPIIGLRPFVINGAQRTYSWLRSNGFKTFNHYWSHIDIEHGDVHQTLIELIQHLQQTDLIAMYTDMLPDLLYNRERFFEYAEEQKNKIDNIFEHHAR